MATDRDRYRQRAIWVPLSVSRPQRLAGARAAVAQATDIAILALFDARDALPEAPNSLQSFGDDIVDGL
jgi:hypothetical protein